MTTLITGGTGFIGAEVARMLLQRGEERVAVFDINPNTTRLSDVLDRVDVVRGDLGTYNHVLDAVRRFHPSVIYHLGGMLSVPSDADPPSAFRANAEGTFNVLEAARVFEVPQVIYSSTLATFGDDIEGDTVSDLTVQHPTMFYGATKVFGELMGRFYRRKYGLDFRAVRYPSIVGPGVRTPGVAQWASWVIEDSAKGKPFTMWIGPHTRIPLMYYKDSARAAIALAAAPRERIVAMSYLVSGPQPPASAGELVGIVQSRIPTASIDYQPDPDIQRVLDEFGSLDDRFAREEWGWEPAYELAPMVDDFLAELERHPERYT